MFFRSPSSDSRYVEVHTKIVRNSQMGITLQFSHSENEHYWLLHKAKNCSLNNVLLSLFTEHGSRHLSTIITDRTSRIPKMSRSTVGLSIPIAMVTIIVIITTTTGIPCRICTNDRRLKICITTRGTVEDTVAPSAEECMEDDHMESTICQSRGFTFLEDRENL